MNFKEQIKNYFYAVNSLSINLMYTNEYLDLSNLKKYNPGHLGTSMNMNFILANLYYYLNNNALKSQIVIGAGHAGLSLISNLFLNGTLSKYYPKYSLDRKGVNNLIKDFGGIIRSEINPQYPDTIYDGGELGYSLATSYGYAISNSSVDIIPCIIGDGECETATLLSSWQLNKLLTPQSKVLPIINLNGLKMGSNSYLKNFNNKELINFFKVFGYEVFIVDTINNNLENSINDFQKVLNLTTNSSNPLIIVKSLKGFTLPECLNYTFEGNTFVHKNPLASIDNVNKTTIIKQFLEKYFVEIFDEYNNLLPFFQNFQIESPKIFSKSIKSNFNINDNLSNIEQLEDYLNIILKNNDGKIFSPDELFSNMLGKNSLYTIELLNENVLQGLYQGFIKSGNIGYFISYEGFMPIIDSMIAQHYKYLYQKKLFPISPPNNCLNYILTSTYSENTYSHQNPGFVNSLLDKDDLFYNIFYPKDGKSLIQCLEYTKDFKDMINVYITSKRHTKKYQDSNEYKRIEVIIDSELPDIILCATGDYMLDLMMEVYNKLKDNYHVKILYITEPKILDNKSKNSLSEDEINFYFNSNVPVIYGFMGYPSIIKSLLYNINKDVSIFGYDEKITLNSNVTLNNDFINDILNISKDKINKYQNNKVLRRER